MSQPLEEGVILDPELARAFLQALNAFAKSRGWHSSAKGARSKARKSRANTASASEGKPVYHLVKVKDEVYSRLLTEVFRQRQKIGRRISSNDVIVDLLNRRDRAGA